MTDEQKGESIMDLDLTDVKPLVPVEAGTYDMQILSAKRDQFESTKHPGKTFKVIRVLLKIMDRPEAALVNHTFFLPGPDDTQEQADSAKRRLRFFCEAFGLELSTHDIDEWVASWKNATGQAILKQVDSEEFGVQNEVKRFLVQS